MAMSQAALDALLYFLVNGKSFGAGIDQVELILSKYKL
jgi:hypothetical protein